MKKLTPNNNSKWVGSVFLLAASGVLIDLSHAATPTLTPAQTQTIKENLPGSTQPGLIGKFLTPLQQPSDAKEPLAKREEKATSSLGPQADQIKFKLVKIILEDNHVFSDQQLEMIYRDKLNTTIAVSELQQIVQDITNFYRNNGYILSRAILPPQHVSGGVVRIRIIEGFIDQVNIIGKPRGAKAQLEKYAEKITLSRPLQLKTMEYYLRIANEVPGVQARAVLEPSKDKVGGTNLNMVAQTSTFNGSLSYDNYGTRYIGPQQTTANLAFNSIFTSGDTTRLTYSTTATRKQLSFYDVSYQWMVGSNGLAFALGKNRSATVPGFVLAPLDVVGEAVAYYGNFTYPLIRTRDRNLTLDGGFNYLDSTVSSFDQLLYMDHLRPIRAGGNYSFADRYAGSNLWALHVEQGLSILNASTNTNSTTTSRPGGSANYTKFVLQIVRMQAIRNRLSAYFMMNGQYTFTPLLASSQYAYGGSQLGRGYDPAEIIGDRGMGGTLELRLDFAPGWRWLQSLQPYVFYDAGVIWNIKNIPNTEQKQSAMSTGIGSRFFFTNYVSGNLMWAQPLTREVAAEQIIGRGKNPRVFFSLMLSV